MMSSANLTTSTVGAVGSIMAWRGATAIGGKLITMSAYSGGVLAVGQGAATLIEGYANHSIERSDILERSQSQTVASVGTAKTTDQYADIPGLKPQAAEYQKLHEWVGEINREKPKYSNGSIINPKELLDNPKGLEDVTAGLAIGNRNYAENIRKAEFDGMITRETVMSTTLGRYTSLPLANLISGRDIEKEVGTAREKMDDANRRAALGSHALTEIAGDMGNGKRNYQQRYADYERLIKPLEKEYPSQIQELEKLRQVTIALNDPKNQGYVRAAELGAKPGTQAMTDFNNAMTRADQEDAVRTKQATELATKKDMAGIQKFLGVSDTEWKQPGSNGKSLEKLVKDRIKDGQILPLLKGHVQATSATRQAVAEQLGKITFAQEMEKVEKMSPEEQEAYFTKNREFIQKAELQGRRDLGLIGLSTSATDYMAKKMEFTPQAFEEQAVKESLVSHKQLKAMKNETAAMANYIPGAESSFKALTGRDMEPAPMLDQDGKQLINDKGQPLTVTEFKSQLAGIIRQQEKATDELRIRRMTNKDPDLTAKQRIQGAGLSALKLQYETLEQQEMGYKLAQYENAKMQYRNGTAEMFQAAGGISPEDAKQGAVGEFANESRELAQRYTDLANKQKSGKPVDIAELQQVETKMLLAHRALAEKVEETIAKTGSKVQPREESPSKPMAQSEPEKTRTTLLTSALELLGLKGPVIEDVLAIAKMGKKHDVKQTAEEQVASIPNKTREAGRQPFA